MTNPYAPPTAVVQDIADPSARIVHAGRGIRLGAAMLDSIIFVAMVYLPAVFSIAFAAAAPRSADPGVPAAMIAGGGVLTITAFIAWCWLNIRYMRRNGQSIAKKLVGIKVVRSDGSPASLGRLIWLRNVVNWAISIVPVYGFLDSIFIFGESRQCLHDKIADTIVVKA
jgi:uncharacterized RDD family membrane protein YckC